MRRPQLPAPNFHSVAQGCFLMLIRFSRILDNALEAFQIDFGNNDLLRQVPFSYTVFPVLFCHCTAKRHHPSDHMIYTRTHNDILPVVLWRLQPSSYCLGFVKPAPHQRLLTDVLQSHLISFLTLLRNIVGTRLRSSRADVICSLNLAAIRLALS